MGKDGPLHLLGLLPGATEDDVRRAWRRDALATHPDLGGDRDAFERVRATYEAMLSGGITAPAAGPARRPDPYRTFLDGMAEIRSVVLADSVAPRPVAARPVSIPSFEAVYRREMQRQSAA
jgi:hypothetical protein